MARTKPKPKPKPTQTVAYSDDEMSYSKENKSGGPFSLGGIDDGSDQDDFALPSQLSSHKPPPPVPSSSKLRASKTPAVEAKPKGGKKRKADKMVEEEEPEVEEEEAAPPAKNAKRGNELNEAIKAQEVKIAQLNARHEKDKAKFEGLKVIYEELKDLRTTEPENQLILINEAHDKRVESLFQASELQKSHNATLQSANDELRRQLATLRQSTGLAAAAEEYGARIEELEELNVRLKAEAVEQRDRRKEAERVLKKVQSGAEGVKAELEAKLDEQVKELEEQVDSLTKENKLYEADSQRLIAENKSLKSTSHNPAPSSSNAVGASTNAGNRDVEELEHRLELIENMTGISFLRSGPGSNGSRIYECIISDTCGNGLALAFRIHDHGDDTWTYTPHADPQRDAKALEKINTTLHQPIRLPNIQLPHVFASFYNHFNIFEQPKKLERNDKK